MDQRTEQRVEDWESQSFPGGYGALHELADAEFSGAVVTAGDTWLFMLNGRALGVFQGRVEDFETASGTVYRAPDPSLPLLFAMLERGGEQQARYYTEDTPISEAHQQLSDAQFTGYIELSENVVSGDYYVAYYGGRSMSCAFVGSGARLLTGDEAFQRADDEVGIYEVRTVDVDVVEIPGSEPDPGHDRADAAGGTPGGDPSRSGPDPTGRDPTGAPQGAGRADDGPAGGRTDDEPTAGGRDPAEDDLRDPAPADDPEPARGTPDDPEPARGAADPGYGEEPRRREAAPDQDEPRRGEPAPDYSPDQNEPRRDESEPSRADEPAGGVDRRNRPTKRDSGRGEPAEPDSGRGGSTDRDAGAGRDPQPAESDDPAADERTAADRDDAERRPRGRRTEEHTGTDPDGSAGEGGVSPEREPSPSSGADAEPAGRDPGRERSGPADDHGDGDRRETDAGPDRDRRDADAEPDRDRRDADAELGQADASADRPGASADRTGDDAAGTEGRASDARSSAAEPADRRDEAGGERPGDEPPASASDPDRPADSRDRPSAEPRPPSAFEAVQRIPSLDPGRTASHDDDEVAADDGAEPTVPGAARDATAAEPATTASTTERRSPEEATGGAVRSAAASEDGGTETVEPVPEDAPEDLQAALAEREERIEELDAKLADLRVQRDGLRDERDQLRSEVERLEGEIDDLESEVETLRDRLNEGTEGRRRLSPEEVLRGTNLFVRYDSKSAGTLEDAHAGDVDAEEVNSNLQLEHHTQFEAGEVAVGGQPFEEFFADSIHRRYVEWAVRDLLYEIRDTGNVKGMRGLYDALPKVDRADLLGEVSVEYTEGGETYSESRQFDVVLRDRMGNPLVVADLNDSRSPATRDMMGGVVEHASEIKESHDSLSAAMLVTASFFEPGALEVAEETTASGGLVGGSSRESYVKLSRKRGYHLLLVESRDAEFYVNVPEL